MKLKELMNINRYCYVHEKNLLARYDDKEVIVAYFKDFFGTVCVIKGKMKFFGLISLRDIGGLGGIRDCGIENAYKLLQESNGMIIVDQGNYELLQKQLLVDSIRYD